MSGRWLIMPCLLAAGCMTTETVFNTPAQNFELLGEFSRPSKPEGLSGITAITGERYYAVDDRGGMMYELKLTFDERGERGKCEILRSQNLAGRRDLEGCALDSLTGWLWVSDESDTSVNAYDPLTGAFKSMIAVPEIYRGNVRKNRSLEALTISADGMRMYFANEDTLKCDGEPSTREHGGKVRIQELVRESGKWQLSRQFFYETDQIGGELYKTHSISSVASMLAMGNGILYVMERELSVKDGLFPTFRARIYMISAAADGATAEKQLVWESDTGFTNYEGMCRGPRLSDGNDTIILISDGGGPAAENFAVLKAPSF